MREDSSSASAQNLNGRESLCYLRHEAAQKRFLQECQYTSASMEEVRCGADFPGIEASVPVIECQFPPLRSKSVSLQLIYQKGVKFAQIFE
jgi:hypothetical protein